MSSCEGREDCQQSIVKGTQASLGTTVIAVTILLILSILFSRVTVNVLAFVLRVVFFMYIVTRYMYDARHRDFALSASFDVSEVTAGKGNESIVLKENCFVQEIKEVELRSRRRKFIYNRTYNPVALNKVSHFSRRGRTPSRLPMKKLKSLLKKTRQVRLFVWKGILKITPLSSKIHCYVKNRKGLHLELYRSNC